MKAGTRQQVEGKVARSRARREVRRFGSKIVREANRLGIPVRVLPTGRRPGDLARSAARLCRLAGADADAIPAWIEEGRRRSANARRPPFSG